MSAAPEPRIISTDSSYDWRVYQVCRVPDWRWLWLRKREVREPIDVTFRRAS